MDEQQGHRVVFLGPSKVGKSSLIEARFGNWCKDAATPETVGVSIHHCVENIGLREVFLTLVDVSGDLQCGALAAPFVATAPVVVLVFNYEDRTTLDAVSALARELDLKGRAVILAGTKADRIRTSEILVSSQPLLDDSLPSPATTRQLSERMQSISLDDAQSDTSSLSSGSLDMPCAGFPVRRVEAERAALALNAQLVDCSARTRHNISLLFSMIARAVQTTPLPLRHPVGASVYLSAPSPHHTADFYTGQVRRGSAVVTHTSSNECDAFPCVSLWVSMIKAFLEPAGPDVATTPLPLHTSTLLMTSKPSTVTAQSTSAPVAGPTTAGPAAARSAATSPTAVRKLVTSQPC